MPFKLALVILFTTLFIVIGESRYKNSGSANSDLKNHAFRTPEQPQEDDKFLQDNTEEDYPVEDEDGESKEGDKADCPSCGEAKLSEEEIRKLRIEKIKQKILHKLRLKVRPNVTISRKDLPTPLSHGHLSSDQTDYSREPRVRYDYYGRTEHVIIFPDEKTIPCYPNRHHPAECLHFPQATNFPEGSVFSAELWVYKLPDDNDYQNQTFQINDLISTHKYGIKKRHNETRVKTSVSFGWMKFDVKHAIRVWITHSHFEHWLEVVCKSCAMNSTLSPISQSNGQRPFLVISMDNNQEKLRNKRSVTCDSDTTQCCRESLYISFREIGWDDWIFQPSGYTANYCRGSCMEDVTIPMSGSHHTTVMQRYVQSKNLTPDQKIILTPCCTPTHMSEISLLYMAESGTIVHKKLPDMVVDACGCS